MTTATMLSQHTKTHLRASQLMLSPHNVRQTPHSAGYLEELAASIKSGGLMHAITVHPMTKQRGAAFYGVCAGGGRYAAIQLLVSRGDIDDERDLVECNLIDEKEAIHLSLAENVHREPLHPADEYDGFKRMIDAGESVEDIAAAFGVSPVVVQRRLRLANVDASFITLFRAGDIKLDQLMALAMTTDPALQCRIWQELPEYNRTASRIRAALVGEKLDVARSPLVQFVGVDAYTEAGGVIEQDLFAQQDKAGFIVDVPLLESLARTRLDAVAEQYREEGWGWVTVCLDRADVDQHQYSRAPFSRRASTDEEQTRLDDIKRELNALYQQEEEDDLSEEASEMLDALNEEYEQSWTRTSFTATR